MVAATMSVSPRPPLTAARAEPKQRDYEVLVFHATVAPAAATMESLIEAGVVTGVLDITTTELADDLVGGRVDRGPHRLHPPGLRGVPQLLLRRAPSRWPISAPGPSVPEIQNSEPL